MPYGTESSLDPGDSVPYGMLDQHGAATEAVAVPIVRGANLKYSKQAFYLRFFSYTKVDDCLESALRPRAATMAAVTHPNRHLGLPRTQLTICVRGRALLRRRMPSSLRAQPGFVSATTCRTVTQLTRTYLRFRLVSPAVGATFPCSMSLGSR